MAAVQQGSLQLPNARNLFLPVIPQAAGPTAGLGGSNSAASQVPVIPAPPQLLLSQAQMALSQMPPPSQVPQYDPVQLLRSQGIIQSLMASQSCAVEQSHEIKRPIGKLKLKGLDNNSLHVPN